MDITNANLKFRGTLGKRSSTKRIIAHHAEATSCSPQQIHDWHLDNGWSGAGYHFLVRKDGSTYSLRPEWAIGAHAAGANSDSIGICFEGNFNVETMGDAQIEAGRQLVAHLKSKYGIQTVVRHKDVNNTDCPGANFPFESILDIAQKPEESTPEPSEPSETATTTSNFGGTYLCRANGLRIRTSPRLGDDNIVPNVSYNKGNTVNLDDWYKIADGYVWGRYTAYSGNVRYVAVGKATGKPEPDDFLVKI